MEAGIDWLNEAGDDINRIETAAKRDDRMLLRRIAF
jgi:hypothetical protein